MLKGFYLTLLVGPAVPAPVPQVVLDALTNAEITCNDVDPSGFQMNFTLSNRSPLHTIFLLAGGSQLPVMRVILVLTAKGAANVLMDGVVTKQQVAPGPTSGSATLSITGEDLTAVMNVEEFSGLPYPATPPEARVAMILAKYASLGIVPRIIPSVMVDVPLPAERVPVQRGTDLRYIQRLADDVGYVFYIDPGSAPGTSTAYWGPMVKSGPVQPALNINMDAQTNCESLSFSFDNQSRGVPRISVQDEDSGESIEIPVPDISPLNPPLGLIPALPTQKSILEGTAKYTSLRAALKGMAEAAKSADAVTGTGTLDVLRYGRPLSPRQLVGVRGAGMAFDGLYYVKSVTHTIKRGEYKQNFTLTRNGLVSTVATVPA